MMKLPVDILIEIIECVDHPRDLLSFALTARALHAEIVPRHIDYRRIVCWVSYDHVWEHLLAHNACSRVRYLDITCMSCRAWTGVEIPRMCKISSSSKTMSVATVGSHNIEVFLRALSKMTNLKVLKFDATGRRLCLISEAIGKANCVRDLVELDTCVELPRKGGAIDQYFEVNKISTNRGQSPLFYDYLYSLRKYTIRCEVPGRGTFLLQMLLNAPNLTHMNVCSLPSRTFLLGYWPNLQHLVLPYLGEFQGDDTGKSYTYYLRTFLCRHSKLITFSAERALRPGWATEWDNFLPNLKSLEFTSYSSPNVPIIPTRIAERLTHLRMSAVLHSVLKDRGIVLFNLESCVYWDADLEASVRDLVAVIPNVQKLHIRFQFIKRGIFRSPETITTNETVGCLPFFAKFQYLRVLSGAFNGDISVDDNPFPELLYGFPSLSYIWAKWNRKYTPECLRLERDNVARMTRFEAASGLAQDECDIESWGGFYRCNPIDQRRVWTMLHPEEPYILE